MNADDKCLKIDDVTVTSVNTYTSMMGIST